MTTRLDLINLVLDNIDRPDIRDTNPSQPGYWIKRTEQRLERELRMREMIVTKTLLVTNGYVALPSDFIQAENLVLTDLTGKRLQKLEYASPQEADDLSQIYVSSPGALPARFSVIGNNIELYPPAVFDSNGLPIYQIAMAYYPKITPLVNDTDTNWLLTNKTDLYVNACSMYAFAFLQETDRSTAMDQMVTMDVQLMNAAKEIAITAGSRLVARMNNPVGAGSRYRSNGRY